MWLMLQQPSPDDYVLATGETHRVREFVEKAFTIAGVTIKCVYYLFHSLQTSISFYKNKTNYLNSNRIGWLWDFFGF